MATIDSDIIFSSNWDIDLILDAGQVTISGTLPGVGSYPSNVTDIVVFKHGLGYVPVFDLMFLATSQTQWQQTGDSDNQLISYITYSDTQNLHIILGNNNLSSVTYATQLRYYIWTDTVIH